VTGDEDTVDEIEDEEEPSTDCPNCGGSGGCPPDQACRSCKGTGEDLELARERRNDWREDTCRDDY